MGKWDYGMVEFLGRQVHDKGIATFCALCRELEMPDRGHCAPCLCGNLPNKEADWACDVYSDPVLKPLFHRHGLRVQLTGDKEQAGMGIAALLGFGNTERSQDNGESAR